MTELIGYRARQPSAMHWNQVSSCVRGGILGRIDDPAAAANSDLSPVGALAQRRSDQRERGERAGAGRGAIAAAAPRLLPGATAVRRGRAAVGREDALDARPVRRAL